MLAYINSYYFKGLDWPAIQLYPTAYTYTYIIILTSFSSLLYLHWRDMDKEYSTLLSTLRTHFLTFTLVFIICKLVTLVTRAVIASQCIYTDLVTPVSQVLNSSIALIHICRGKKNNSLYLASFSSEVVASSYCNNYCLPSQRSWTIANPVLLQMHSKLPIVLTQRALAAQGLESHSLVSRSIKNNRLN